MSMIKETRQMGDFNQIAMKGWGKILISQGAEQSVVVEADDHLIKRITTEVVNGKLVIDVGRDWMERMSAGLEFLSSREINFIIVVKKLDSLEIMGASDTEVDRLNADEFDLRMSGASNVKVKDLSAKKLLANMPGAGKVMVTGKVDEQEVNVTGAGNYDATKLETKNTKVSLTGVGNATVWAKENLDVSVTGVGSIEYYGNPRVKQSTSMLGAIRNMGEAPK
jgi:hypothetical protein